MKRCSGNTQQIYREHPYRSMISIKLLCNFMEITLRNGFSPVYLLHIFRTTFLRTSMEGYFWRIMKSYSGISWYILALPYFSFPFRQSYWDIFTSCIKLLCHVFQTNLENWTHLEPYLHSSNLTLLVPIPDKEKKLS